MTDRLALVQISLIPRTHLAICCLQQIAGWSLGMRLGSESIQQSGEDQLAVMQFIASSAYNDTNSPMDSPKGNHIKCSVWLM